MSAGDGNADREEAPMRPGRLRDRSGWLTVSGNPARWARLTGRLLVVAGLAGLVTLGSAAPAAAHEAGASAADQRVRIVAITPPVSGLTVRFVEAGALLELHNDTGRMIEVLG